MSDAPSKPAVPKPAAPPAVPPRRTRSENAQPRQLSPGEELETLIRARYPIIYVVSWEEERVERCLREIADRREKSLFVWTITEGIVKSGSFSIEQGVGVRAISGEKTAFAYSDEISLPALQDAARATRAIGHSGKSQSGKVAVRGKAPRRYEPLDPLATLDADEKIRLLERLEQLCRAADPARHGEPEAGAPHAAVGVAGGRGPHPGDGGGDRRRGGRDRAHLAEAASMSRLA